MPGDYLELFWTLLGVRNLEQLKRSIPDDFDWSVLHPINKTTILVEALNLSGEDNLNLIEWLVEKGANFSQKCGRPSGTKSLWGKSKERKISVNCENLSFLSYISAWRTEFKGKDEWKQQALFLDKVVDRIAEASSQPQSMRPRAPVDLGIIENWENYLASAASHDLTIEAADGCVTAHAQMLKQASPVVQAMLGSPMKECQSQQIQLRDTSSSAVRLVLETLYTCSSQSDPDYKTALSALDLAHRWQMEVVVAILSDLVAELITAESFAAIAEHAALKGLDTLKKACQSFGSQNAAIQAQIKKDQFPKAVLDLFSGSKKTLTSQPAKKRKRL